MKNPKVAKEFFEARLPDFLRKDIDLSTLNLRQDSFVGDDLRQHIADLLFEVSVKGDKGYIYLLAEHQSTPQKLMPFRILQYIVAIQKQHLEEHTTDVLPFVYPLLLYAGKTKYTYSLDLFTLFGPQEDLARQVWRQPYQLIDLTQIPDEELDPYLFFGTMAQIMKHIRDANLLPFLRAGVQRLKKIEETGEEGYIRRSLTYFIEAGQIPEERPFLQMIAQGLTTLEEEDLMTLAEQWKQQGLERGIQQGMQQGMQTVALKMLAEKMPFEKISRVTDLSEKELKKLQATLH